MIKKLLSFEEIALFILALMLFFYTGQNPVWFFVFLLYPDIGMIGYLVNAKFGAITYNIIHNRVTAIVLIAIGVFANNIIVIDAGLIMFAHIAMDRFLGYGLKYRDSFENTHLGKIGKSKKS